MPTLVVMLPIVLAIAIVLVVGAFALALRQSWDQIKSASSIRDQFEALRAALGGASVDTHAFNVTRGPVRLRFALTFDGEGDFQSMQVLAQMVGARPNLAPEGPSPYRVFSDTLAVDYRLPIMLRAETRRDRIGKALLLNREAQTGDASFDRRVYIESYHADATVRRALASVELRKSATELLDAGWEQVTLYADGGEVMLSSSAAKSALLDAGSVGATVDATVRLCASLPRVNARRSGKPKLTKGWLAVIIASLLLVVSWVWGFAAPHVWTPFENALYWTAMVLGVGLLSASAPVVVLLLRGRPDSLRHIAIVLILAALSFPMLATGALCAANGLLDFSPPAEKTTTLMSLEVSGGENDSYYARVKACTPGGGTWRMHISEDTYAQLRASGAEGKNVVITAHPGALGWAWWSDIRPAKAP